MKNRVAIMAGAALLAVEGMWLIRRLRRKFPMPASSFESLHNQTELDLNQADPEQLRQLGLNSESVGRLVENRPYRNKMELLSRIVVTENEYDLIKDRISVHNASEPVKIA